MTALAGILFTLVVTLAIGVVLRRTGRVPADAAHVLNRLILDVTMPALIVVVLARAQLDRAIVGAIVAMLAAQIVGVLGGVGVTRLLGLPRATQGAAGLTAGFSNTGFLGVPLTIAVFGTGLAASTAVLVDSFNTTVLLWTAGLLFARVMVTTPGTPSRSIVSVLLSPLTLALAVGLVLNVAHVVTPPIVNGALESIGAATTAMVFLSLGLSLDFDSLKGRMRAIVLVALVRLVAAPLTALLVVRLLGLHGPVAQVGVLEAAMPTSMASVVLASESGCDGPFASATTVATTLLAIATLPFVLALVKGY